MRILRSRKSHPTERQLSTEPTHKLKQGSFNGKPKTTFPLSFDKTVAFGLPLNEFVRPLYNKSIRMGRNVPIDFNCSGCGQLLRVPDESAGAQAKCSVCSATSPVPMAETQPVSPPHDVTNPYASPRTFPEFDTQTFQAPIGRGFINAELAISTAWELFKVNIALLVGVHLILLFSNMVASGILGFVQAAVASAQGKESAAAILLTGLCNVAIKLLQLFLGIGTVRINLSVGQGNPAEIGMLFSGGRYLPRIVGGSILYGLLVLIGTLALIIPGIYLALKYWPYYYFIVDRDCGIGDSFSLAGEYTTGNKFSSIGLWLISVGLVMLGMLMCCVGIIFTFPIVSLTWALGYLMMTSQQVHQPHRFSV